MNHPECLPEYRACAGTCGRTYALSADNFPTRKGEPNRYPWQRSYYRPRCHRCHREYLGDLRARTKANRYAKEAERQRTNRAAIKGSLGMSWEAIKDGRADYRAQKSKALSRAARVAETRRVLRGERPYTPATDPFKRMIRERQSYYLTRRLRREQMNAAPPDTHQQPTTPPDYLRLLAQLRNRQAK
jgi:hypothetical protein